MHQFSERQLTNMTRLHFSMSLNLDALNISVWLVSHQWLAYKLFSDYFRTGPYKFTVSSCFLLRLNIWLLSSLWINWLRSIMDYPNPNMHIFKCIWKPLMILLDAQPLRTLSQQPTHGHFPALHVCGCADKVWIIWSICVVMRRNVDKWSMSGSRCCRTLSITESMSDVLNLKFLIFRTPTGTNFILNHTSGGWWCGSKFLMRLRLWIPGGHQHNEEVQYIKFMQLQIIVGSSKIPITYYLYLIKNLVISFMTAFFYLQKNLYVNYILS